MAGAWRFHPNHGGSVKLSPDCTVAENIEDVFGVLTGFLVFTDSPVPLGSQFVLRGIDAPLYQPRMGLTTMCPDNIQFADLPNSLTELHSSSFEDSWLWTKNETICNPDGDSDIIVIEGTNVNIQEAYKLGLMVTPEGDLHLLADGKVIGMDWRSVPTDKPLWGVAEVHLTKLKLEVQAPRYPWEFVALNDVHTNSLCDINLELEKGMVIKAYVADNFNSMMSIAKGGFHMWGSTGQSEGWVHSASVRDITTENYKELLSTAMEDGFVVATIIKILIIGSPGAGKTGVRQLLLGMPPPEKRSSTPLAIEASQAIAEWQDGQIVWKEVDTNTLLDILAEAIKHVRKGLPNPALTTSLSFSVRNSVSANSLKSLAVGDNDSLYHSSIRNWFNPPKGVESLSSMRPVTSADKILERMLFKEETTKGSEQKTWIYCIDCGGDRVFLDILPQFIRGSTVNVLPINISENLNEKLQSEYIREDEPLRGTSNMSMTGLELTESLVCSYSSFGCHFQYASSAVPKPKFLLVGTHADKIRPKKMKETLYLKDESIQAALQPYQDLCITGGQDGQLIYPLDTRTQDNREEIASTLRKKIIEGDGVSVEVAIPSRWHTFEVELQRRTERMKRTVLTLAECIRLGATMKMEELDVEDALVFFDQLSLYFYFPTAAPHVIFTVPQDLLEETTGLLEIGTLNLEHLPPNIPHQLANRLRQEGLFDRQLVSLACQKHRVYIGEECVYTEDDFLAIMKHLLIVAHVIISGKELFFMPCVLPNASPAQVLEEKKKYTNRLEPVLLQCENKVRLQGLFPALTVVLLNRQTEHQFVFIGQQFRNAVTLRSTDLGGALFLVEHFSWMEVCYSGNPSNAPRILSVLKESIAEVCIKLSYNPDEIIFKERFWCQFSQRGHTNNSHSCHTVQLASGNLELSCGHNPDIHRESSDPRQMTWLAPSTPAPTASTEEPYDDNDVTYFEHIACWMPGKWKEMGRCLGIVESQLSVFDKKNADPLDCFAKVLSCWQKLQCSQSIERWPTLIDVLSSLGEKVLAESLKDQFGQDLSGGDGTGPITGNQFVTKLSSTIPTKWRQVGIELNLPQQVIEHIGQRHHDSPRHCYGDVFVLWRKLPFTARPVNWLTLIDALRSPSVEAVELADLLEAELGQDNSSTPSVTGEGFLEHVATAIPVKWKLVGRALGLTHQQLDRINRQKDGNPDGCYSEVFDTWQQRQYATSKPVNWAIVTTALRSPIVGDDDLATRLEEQFVTSISGNDFLQQVARKIPEKWRSVGRALGIPGPKITEIDQKYHDESDNCFAEVYVAWISLPCTRKPVNWSTLVSALQSPSVGETKLASTLEEVFVGIENYVFV